MGVSSESKSNEDSQVNIKETCPSFRRGHVPSFSDVKRLRTLSVPHVGSFDYFLEKGLAKAVMDIVPFEIDLVNPKTAGKGKPKEVQTLRMWIESARVDRPVKSDNFSKTGGILTPRECRELGLMYSGPMVGEFCYQISERKLGEDGVKIDEIPGNIVKVSKKFGDMPIMVMSKACHLHGKRPEQLVQMKEEVCGVKIYVFLQKLKMFEI